MTQPDRLAEAHDRLVAAIEHLVNGEEWQRFLDTARHFRSYSLNNLLLIFAQRPEATQVAGYRTWQSLGRQVRRGESGIAILAPCTYKRSDDGDTDNNDESGETVRVLRGFKVVHVFDVAQTDGDALPSPPVQLLDRDDPHHVTERLASVIADNGYTFTLGPMPAGHEDANGVTTYDTRAVVVRDELSPAQQAKTTAHELAHVLLHAPDRGQRPDRAVCEIEAESVAYLVCGNHGLASDDYSFGYLATWARGDTDAVRATSERVINCAAQILDALGTNDQIEQAA
jgi:antirestriction protein ArdC